jgi:hypothetical protein
MLFSDPDYMCFGEKDVPLCTLSDEKDSLCVLKSKLKTQQELYHQSMMETQAGPSSVKGKEKNPIINEDDQPALPHQGKFPKYDAVLNKYLLAGVQQIRIGDIVKYGICICIVL